ncbi:MAG: pantoate--beta-alanine ligase [Bacteroidales bacterium]|nr:pantoate--beta-alanine ligase [Bacteroidales bacterium]
MKVVENRNELNNTVADLRSSGRSIGFVPTMGALHEGHLSLIECSNRENDITIVSIFVNPTQFNDSEDYKRYPRIIQDDIKKLKRVKCDFLFTPSKDEMYPDEDKREFDFGNLESIMEGAHRPGHFRGVALIVSKLFEIVNPHRAYFGEKDFQQVAIINRLTKLLNLDIKIVSCPIMREKDGLAMSSRNMLLSTEQRDNVSIISETLFDSLQKKKILSIAETKEWVIRKINENPFLEVEYFEIVDSETLNSVNEWSQVVKITGCIAVQVGNIRLIDNIRFYS